jgi:hypothetical protein
MAVFSNDPRAQALWDREKMLNLITSSPCPDTRQQITDLCNNDPDKLRRLGYAGCRKVETVKNNCQDYDRNVKAKAQASADLAKYLKDTAKAKSDKDKKAAEFAAEQAILARRRASNASLESAVKTACVSTMNVGEPRRTAILEDCFKARTNFEKKKVSVDNDIRVTFDEVARELGTSKASGKAGKKPAKLKAKAKAKAKAAAKLKKKNR